MAPEGPGLYRLGPIRQGWKPAFPAHFGPDTKRADRNGPPVRDNPYSGLSVRTDNPAGDAEVALGGNDGDREAGDNVEQRHQHQEEEG